MKTQQTKNYTPASATQRHVKLASDTWRKTPEDSNFEEDIHGNVRVSKTNTDTPAQAQHGARVDESE